MENNIFIAVILFSGDILVAGKNSKPSTTHDYA